MSAEQDAGCVPCEVCGGSQDRGWHQHPAPTAEHYLHPDADTRKLIAEAELRGAVRALREARRLAVRCYPKGLTPTATVVADLNEAIDRIESAR